MDKIKPKYKYWAAQPRLTLQEGAQLINATEPNPQKNGIFEGARPGASISRSGTWPGRPLERLGGVSDHRGRCGCFPSDI